MLAWPASSVVGQRIDSTAGLSSVRERSQSRSARWCVGWVRPGRAWFLPRYWLLGAGLGFVYPPLIAWLNRGSGSAGDGRDVSRRLILFCVAWNFGMMAGQLTAGSLFAVEPEWTYRVGFVVAMLNVVLALIAALSLHQVHDEAKGEGHTVVQNRSIELAARFKRLSWIANLGGMFGGSLVIHLLPDLAVTIGIAADRHGNLLAGWRAVVIATYLLLHFTDFWHYRFRVSLASQILGALGLAVIFPSGNGHRLSAGTGAVGPTRRFQLFLGSILQHAWQCSAESGAGRRASRSHPGGRHEPRHDRRRSGRLSLQSTSAVSAGCRPPSGFSRNTIGDSLELAAKW